jgi:outer membrane lipoprotein-sorting protein
MGCMACLFVCPGILIQQDPHLFVYARLTLWHTIDLFVAAGIIEHSHSKFSDQPNIKEVTMRSLGVSKWVFLGGVVLFLCTCANTSSATEYIAEMTETVHRDGEVSTSKVYVKGSKYRIEEEEEGQEIVVLVDQEKGVTRVLLPAEKMYAEMASDDIQSLMNDPFQAVKYTETIGEKTKTGTEKISGYECDVYTIKRDGDDIMRLWVSEKLSLPVKIEIPGEDGRTMLMHNIKTGKIEDVLFVLPDGYTKMEESGKPEIELPAWIENIASAKYVEPPFEQMMLDEEILRVKVVEGRGVKISGTNELAERSAFMAVPFMEGRPISDPTMYMFNLTYEGQTWSNTFRLTTYEADEIIIRVEEGTIMLKLEAVDLGIQETVSAGEEFKASIRVGYNIDFRLVNTLDGESVCTVTMRKEGQELSDDIIGPEEHRTYTLNKKGESKQNTWSSSGYPDEFIVRVQRGEILVSFSQ